ncbi:hypothetical protein FSP39_007568 [Pinctada imbricata]|uniref:Hexosyltransferase n=1 Tax=Pinctada imbricata TaxID=66713 RepID=A0AA89C1B7_PINIB|nr:hypothetical protein FSP39_007568 [Pinctada imbricata]
MKCLFVIVPLVLLFYISDLQNSLVTLYHIVNNTEVLSTTERGTTFNVRNIFPLIKTTSKDFIQKGREYYRHPKINCVNNNINILSIVKSSAKNERLRLAIRNTWGKHSSNVSNRLVFSLGRTNDTAVQQRIEKEAEMYKDILQSNFIDNYLNLTIKTERGIHWVSQYCAGARFVLFVDDDVIVNFKVLEKFLFSLPSAETQNLFTGYVSAHSRPYRDGSKFGISVKEYPLTFYPPYVSGPVVLTTGKVMQMFDKEIPKMKRFVFEDVFLGMVAEKLHIKLSQKYNGLFDHMGWNVKNLPCFLTSHQAYTKITGEIYEQMYNMHANGVCKQAKPFLPKL